MTTVVLGLDGAGFELLESWLGDPLENLQRIRANGVSANLSPCYPPVTCPNWQCYAKSMNPGKLGVFWWEHIDPDNREIENMSAAGDFDGEFFWDYLDGQRAVLNLPTSFPPMATDGVHVAGGPGSEQTDYTSPPEFEEQLAREYGYRVHPEKLSLLDKDNPHNDCIDEIRELIDIRFDVLVDMVQSDDYEFVHMSLFYINMLQHFYYDHGVVRETWEVIDERVGELLELEGMTNLFVMSDHGSNRVETWFSINSWLEQEGHLVRQRGVSDWLTAAGLTRERARSALGFLGIEWWARKLIPERIQRKVPDSEGAVDRSAKAELIDWDQSKAVASGQGPLYILSTDPDEREEIRERLIDELAGIQSPDGDAVCRNVWRGEDVYQGPYLEMGPDLVIEQASGVHIDGGIGAGTTFAESRKWNGENTMSGVFMACGEDIADEFDADRISITDIGPSVLHLHGRPVPEQMDGIVLEDIYADDSDPSRREPEISSNIEPSIPGSGTKRTDSKVNERLENLGYLE